MERERARVCVCSAPCFALSIASIFVRYAILTGKMFHTISTLLQDKTFGKIIFRHGGTLVLYRGRNYNPKKRPVIPLMLWRPHEPVYPKLIKTTIEGLSIEETKEMRKRGLAVPVLTKLGMSIFPVLFLRIPHLIK